jgi:hypothetical protein
VASRKTLEPITLANPALQNACDAFMRLVADHGTFHLDQILVYARGRVGADLTRSETSDVVAYVVSCGAKRGWDHNSNLFHFKPRRSRRAAEGQARQADPRPVRAQGGCVK